MARRRQTRSQTKAKEAAIQKEPTKAKGNAAPTVAQIKADKLTLLANKYWSPHNIDDHLPFDADIIVDIYENDILRSETSTRNIILLEFSQYLENYLWPNFDGGKSSHAHIMSIVMMSNEKFRERVDAWNVFQKQPKQFAPFFHRVLESSLSDVEFTPVVAREQTALLLFLNHCFNSMEVELCREQTKKLVSLGTWFCLQPKRRDAELATNPQWKKFWKKLQKKEKNESRIQFERHYLQRLMIKFFCVLDGIPRDGFVLPDVIRYCERFLELVIDLEALLPTRRFFNTVLDDCHLVVRCALSPLVDRTDGELFNQLLGTLKFYSRFEINDQTGDALTDHDMTQLHYSKIISLQRAAFAKFPALKMFALTNVAAVDTRDKLERHFGSLDQTILRQIAVYLNLLPDEVSAKEFNWHRDDVDFLRELLISRHERRVSQLDALNDMPLYPTGEKKTEKEFCLCLNSIFLLVFRKYNLG